MRWQWCRVLLVIIAGTGASFFADLRYVLGAAGDNCATACQDEGHQCTTASMQAVNAHVLTQDAFGTALTAAGSGYSSCAAYLNEPPTGKDGFAPFVEENGGGVNCYAHVW